MTIPRSIRKRLREKYLFLSNTLCSNSLSHAPRFQYVLNTTYPDFSGQTSFERNVPSRSAITDLSTVARGIPNSKSPITLPISNGLTAERPSIEIRTSAPAFWLYIFLAGIFFILNFFKVRFVALFMF